MIVVVNLRFKSILQPLEAYTEEFTYLRYLPTRQGPKPAVALSVLS